MLAGVAVAVISGRRSEAMAVRLADLGVKRVYMDTANKLTVFCALMKSCIWNRTKPLWATTNRSAADAHRGTCLSVRNAIPKVRDAADWVSGRYGGDGAVREACDLIVARVKEDSLWPG